MFITIKIAFVLVGVGVWLINKEKQKYTIFGAVSLLFGLLLVCGVILRLLIGGSSNNIDVYYENDGTVPGCASFGC